MITITRNKEKLGINIDTKRGRIVSFYSSFNYEIDAVLLKEHLEELFGNRIEEIRREMLMRRVGKINLDIRLKELGLIGV